MEREYQLIFNFSVGGEHRRENPQAPQRRATAATLLQRTSSTEIRGLIERGQLVPSHLTQTCLIVTFFRNERVCLSHFLDDLANGSATRTQDYLATTKYGNAQSYQDAILALRNEVDALSDLDLAMRLRELGFCESTTTFKKTNEGDRVLLWKFRKVMEKSGFWTKEVSPPVASEALHSASLHPTQPEAM